SSWSPTTRTPRRAPGGRSIWTKATSSWSRRHEIHPSDLEEPLAEEAPHLVYPAVDPRQLRHLCPPVGGGRGLQQRRRRGGGGPPGHHPQGVADPAAADHLPGEDQGGEGDRGGELRQLVRRDL